MLRDDGANCVILIGVTKEQTIVPKTAIVEAGGQAGVSIVAKSIQWPTEVSTVRTDGPEGIWTGIATGDEDIPSSNKTFEKRVFEVVNNERTKRGLKALVWDEDLARAARYQAADMFVQSYQDGTHSTLDVFTQHGDQRYIIEPTENGVHMAFA